MEQIKVQEALLILTNGETCLKNRNQAPPKWLPVQLLRNWNSTDLTFEYCIKLFVQIEAAKREKIPPETARQWFIEFLRRDWTKKMLSERYNALISTKIYGIERVEIADWINSVQVYALDEVEIMVKNRVNSLIQRGNFLKGKEYDLNDDDKKAIDLAAAKEVELGYAAGFYEKRETYQEQRKRIWEEKFRSI